MKEFKQLMKEKKISQQNLADKLGVHQTLISQWCTGKGCPTIHQVSAISECLCVPIEKIIGCFANN